ncbi:hypothetical protein M2401_001201 [Pseudomonas sp. JUb42]|jgi:hypothetical protein|uniref:O-antigen ligase family protein n=1 Tax=Pseudomonas sp. JUb42 TaxID=2940611 RepID=UPI002169554A|nr:O-antigen ligase family protein [Pseudomonas sp. JUb42]MCS3467480.1 hypothetical protein [Pseudomonas sp. JUb42]
MPIALPTGLFLALIFSLMFWLLPAPVVLVAMAGLGAGITIIRQPVRGLLLFGLIACFLPYATMNIGFRTTVSEALLMLTWAAYLAHNMFGDPPRVPPMMRTERWLFILMLYTALPFVVGQLMITAEGNGPINWVRWLFNLSALFLVPRLLINAQTLDRMVFSMMAGTLLLLLLSIPVYLVNRSATAMTPILGALGYGGIGVLGDSLSALSTRMGSPWMHPNVAGGAMALTLPLAFCYGITRSGWARSLGLSVAILGSIGLLLTGSRGALVSLMVVMIMMAAKRVPHVGRILMAGAVAGALLLMFYPPLQERLLGLFTQDDTSTAIRFLEYEHFPEAVAQFPLGIGFKIDPPVPGTTLFGISNLWLNFVYKIGIPGMLLYIAVIWSWWNETRPARGRIRLSHDNALWLGTLAGLRAALLSGVFDHYFSFTTVLVALFWLFLGINLHEAKRLKASGVVRPYATPAARTDMGIQS